MNYEVLNRIIMDFLNNADLRHYHDNLDEVVKLANIVLENYYDTDILIYDDDVLLSESIDISKNFFLTISEDYFKQFNELLSSKDIYDGKLCDTVSFFKVPKKLTYNLNRSGVDEEGRVFIDYNETVEDIFNITHEITHKFSYNKKCDSYLKKYLGEVSTILSELYLEDYLKNNTGYNKKEISKHKINRIKSVYDDSLSLIIENILIKLYIQNGTINEKIIIDYLNSLDKNSKLYDVLITRGSYFLKEIIKRGKIDFFYRQRYVIGLFVAIKMKNSCKINYFKKLIEILKKDNSTLSEDCAILREFIPIIGDNSLSVSDNSLTEFTSLFINEKNSFCSSSYGRKV